MDGKGCVTECLYNSILVRRLWTVEKGWQEKDIVEVVRKGIVVGKCCSIC